MPPPSATERDSGTAATMLVSRVEMRSQRPARTVAWLADQPQARTLAHSVEDTLDERDQTLRCVLAHQPTPAP